MTDAVRSSRVGRLAAMAWTAAKTLPALAGKPGGERAAGGDDPHALAAAEALLGSLGELKGLALKVGQMLSYIDGAVPPHVEPALRRALARLQSNAPALAWTAIEPVLRAELGDLDAHFATLEREPFAAASIGQVHAATLHDGTEVVVKVQYPGVREAIEADLGNLGMARGFAAPVLLALGGGSSLTLAKEVLAELAARMREEVDYTHEAAMQQELAAALAGLPDVRIPAVFREHSGARVLTSARMRGRSLDDAEQEPDPALRERWAVALTRAVTQQLWVHGLFHADPHPGNYLFADDGAVVLLDFGCVKRFTPAQRDGMRGYVGAAIRATRTQASADWARFDAAIDRTLRFDQGDAGSRAMLRATLLDWLEPLLRDEPFAFDAGLLRAMNERMAARKHELLYGGGRRLPRVPKMPPTPGDYAFVNRLQWGFFSVLARLHVRVNWHALLPEDMRGGPAASQG
jgi:predicted unusual protein kinase regulating ubiquinone biosynthesis (AarF/ABC1/UbiB family)